MASCGSLLWKPTSRVWIKAGSTNHEAALRLPYKGRLLDLADRHQRSRENGQVIRPAQSLVTRGFRPLSTLLSQPSLFDADNVTVLADVGGFVPDLTAFPLVAKRMRDVFLKTASDNGLSIPTLLSGHDNEGRATRQPHVAIVPLADVGWNYSQGRLMGLALVWPREVAEADRRVALQVIVAFLRDNEVGLLHFGRQGSWSLGLEPESTRASLRFARYVRAARRWGTVLPAALDRHPKDKPGEELASIITNACVNIGLPKEAVDGLDIEVHKHASVRGAPSAGEVRKALPQDSPYRSKPLVHLVLHFPQPVRGPLILGAGAFADSAYACRSTRSGDERAKPGSLPAFFAAVHGQSPFPWQARLARQVVETGSWPRFLIFRRALARLRR